MTNKDKLKIQEVDSISFPDADDVGTIAGLPVAGEVALPFGMPPSIFQSMKKRRFRMLREAKERIQRVLLDMDTWNILWQIDGRRSVEEIAVNLTMTVDEVIYHIESLRLMGIICPVDAVYLPDFIQEKTDKNQVNKNRRSSDGEVDG